MVSFWHDYDIISQTNSQILESSTYQFAVHGRIIWINHGPFNYYWFVVGDGKAEKSYT